MLTVKQLRELIENQPDDMPVAIYIGGDKRLPSYAGIGKIELGGYVGDVLLIGKWITPGN
ncbi:hypothetical protein MBAV_002746 [Candidatus Magnetobacterium bavaricum]|nr:hypothetical protein MBAV_002746 [Candidatus Magnetobacterium bavaricum]